MSRDATGLYSGWAKQRVACPACGAKPGDACDMTVAGEAEYAEHGVHWARTEADTEEIPAAPRPSAQHRVTVVFEFAGDHEVAGLFDDMLDAGVFQDLVVEWAADRDYGVEFTSSYVAKSESLGDEVEDEKEEDGVFSDDQVLRLESVGIEIANGWIRAAQEAGTQADPNYDFSNDVDWQRVREVARELGVEWNDNVSQPADPLVGERMWSIVERGYRAHVANMRPEDLL